MESTKFPCWEKLAAEYELWHKEVTKKNDSPLNFEAWLLRHRTIANELFYDLKRLAVIKKWSRARFFRNAREIMKMKGHYFGQYEPTFYESAMEGVAIKDTVYPWSVITQGDVSKGTEKTPEDDKLDKPAFRLVTKTCTACGEDGSTPAWGRPISFTWNGSKATEKYFACPKPGCTTAWNEWIRASFLANKKSEDENVVKCNRCQSDICVECGAIKPSTVQKYWGQITTTLDSATATGSKPFRKAAHQKGFKERSLTDVYAPLRVEDFYFYGDEPKIPEGQAADGNPKDLMSIAGTSMNLNNNNSIQMTQEEAAEATQKQGDLKQLFEMRADRNVGNAGPEPRGRQIARIDFQWTHDPQPTDRWFSLRNSELYEESARFCQRWFGDVDFPVDYRGPAWLEELGEQFYQYSNLAAAEDSLVASWDTMMKFGRHRRWLVMGILSQIMEKKIHSELLFGATEAENAELEKQDSMFLSSDGYPRTKLRSQMINMFLGDSTVSTNFWPTVDHLTNSTMTILLPLTNLLCYFRTPERWTDTFEMYSQLHSLIAQVGYFAICMQRDPSIFHVLSATPSARMDWGMESQASYDIYRECKEEAEARDKIWNEVQQDIIKNAKADAEAAGTGPEGQKRVADLEKQYRLDRHHRLRGARIKYAVWPMVTRYRPENEGWTLPGGGSTVSRQYGPGVTDEDIERAEGQRILDIGKCVVIYYQGLMYPRPNQPVTKKNGEVDNGPVERDGVTLFEHRAAVKQRALDASRSRSLRGPKFAAALAACSVLVVYRELLLEAVRRNMPSSLAELSAMAKEHSMAVFFTSSAAATSAFLFRRSRRLLTKFVTVTALLFLVLEGVAWGLSLIPTEYIMTYLMMFFVEVGACFMYVFLGIQYLFGGVNFNGITLN
ncbi:hypothetical protein PG989_003541 [Apiospora arundinis]